MVFAATPTQEARLDEPHDAVRRARTALGRMTAFPDAISDPLIVVALDTLRRAGTAVDLAYPLAALLSQDRGYGYDNARRYRWNLAYRGEPNSIAYRLPDATPPPQWRAAEDDGFQRNASGHANRLMEPVVLAAQYDFWERVVADATTPADLARSAAGLLDEAAPIAEHAIGRWFAGRDPWRDTFGLWLLTQSAPVMTRFHHLLFSVALRYGGIAQRDGVVRGVRFPFYERALVSASAQLAGGLWRCGVYPTLIPKLVGFIAPLRQADGGWSDEGRRSDILTTLAAADLLLRLDPEFDPEPTVDWFIRQQEATGWWRALNPEVPWLTVAIADWIERAGQPFATRFEWPGSPIWARDRLSGLPSIATLEELEVALEELPRLGRQEAEVAFLDLAGFGNWNSSHGQARGDDVIRLLGRSLAALPATLAVRIGGDEILLIGKPTAPAGQLEAVLNDWRADWPAQLATIGAGGVAPRIIVTTARCHSLRAARVRLGLKIAEFKRRFPDPPPDGAQGSVEPQG